MHDAVSSARRLTLCLLWHLGASLSLSSAPAARAFRLHGDGSIERFAATVALVDDGTPRLGEQIVTRVGTAIALSLACTQARMLLRLPLFSAGIVLSIAAPYTEVQFVLSTAPILLLGLFGVYPLNALAGILIAAYLFRGVVEACAFWQQRFGRSRRRGSLREDAEADSTRDEENADGLGVLAITTTALAASVIGALP
uniref:Uncharacterized protein n=1 Tax=Calcidiscus leptoporus TaxID=127549 RepID=A0A6U5KKD2_9EUKA|mmetsp:Transcript_45663/g.106506  ORF Transcript_45663/g.106506 Transcript_45663/m.106506 type:complete len:198 (+) Transcript_45663:216-809(+)